MKEQEVYVAIVTYNRKEYLLNLLEALQQSEKKISGILLLDNKSTIRKFSINIDGNWIYRKG